MNTYYFTVRAKNIVGLYSAEKSSDGVIFIDAQDNVIADFTISSAEICLGGQVQFINLSQNASTYLWEITGPQTLTSNLESPSFELQAGIYSVSLTAYGEYGEDTKTDEIEISVVPLPIADFEALNTLVQLPNAVVFLRIILKMQILGYGILEMEQVLQILNLGTNTKMQAFIL